MLEPPEWVSQADAATDLGVSVGKVGFLIASGHLEPSETATGEMGVSRASLDRERAWRLGTSRLGRRRRAAKDALSWT